MEEIYNDDLTIEEIETLHKEAEKEQETIEMLITPTKDDIINAIKFCLKLNPLIKSTPTLINTVYSILTELYLKDKKYVIVEAPTGSGKTIIGFIANFCIQYLYCNEYLDNVDFETRLPEFAGTSYFLTSSKMLQEQIDRDLDRFEFRDYISMLKGVNNYECTHATEIAKSQSKFDKYLTEKDIANISVKYSDRSCIGLKKEEIERDYPCFYTCPYKVARDETSGKTSAILNYAYFLNIMKSEFNPYFGKRPITVCDEAHLIPDIICNMFNIEITQYSLNRALKIINELEYSYGNSITLNLKNLLNPCFKIFSKDAIVFQDIMDYHTNLREFYSIFKNVHKLIPESIESHKIPIAKLDESLKDHLTRLNHTIEFLIKRPEDIFIESEFVFKNELNLNIYKHILKDLAEAELVKEHFLKKIDKAVFMSATLGDLNEFSHIMGIDEKDFSGFRLKSNFDFEKSPVYLNRSAYLNYANFDNNIDSVLNDTIKICENYHQHEKGIIHTSTFKITELLKAKIISGKVTRPERYLFYKTSEEKESCIALMQKDMFPYIIIGPSLYEGLDLVDDLGRFNILVKVPYAALTPYIKKKIERFPFWYKRNTLEKIVQAIGRTNRHVNDYSTTYLLDSLFDKIIYETNEIIINRIQYKKIY